MSARREHPTGLVESGMPTVVAHEHMRHENMDMDMDVRRATCDANVNRRESDEGATQLVSTGTSSERYCYC